MARDFARKFYNSRLWKKCRQSYFLYRHGLCERCSKTGYIVHHKQYITPNNIDNESITLSFNNLELLCLDCHNLEHMGNSATRHDVSFDHNGELVRK